MLKLNTINSEVFQYNSKNDETVGAGKKLSRNKIIASGRLCATEYMGRALGGKNFVSKLHENMRYDAISDAHMRDKILFCAAIAYAADGRPAPESLEAVQMDYTLRKNPNFLRAMASIDTEVLTPLLPAMLSDLNGRVMDLDSVPAGRTKEIVVESNDTFLWEDGAFGSSHSSSLNYLYNDVITLNPKMYTCAASIKWYQMIASDNAIDAGRYYAAIIRGLQSKITAITTAAFAAAAASSTYVPSYLRFNSYSSVNWGSAIVAAAAANGVRAENLMAFGPYSALQAALPSGTPADAALTYGLGEEWFKNGFISMVGRVPLYEVQPAMVPGRVNTSGDLIKLPNNIYITARAGAGRAPIQGVIAEGWPVTLEYSPSETADFEIRINMSTLMDIKPVFANKIAVIENVVLS